MVVGVRFISSQNYCRLVRVSQRHQSMLANLLFVDLRCQRLNTSTKPMFASVAWLADPCRGRHEKSLRPSTKFDVGCKRADPPQISPSLIKPHPRHRSARSRLQATATDYCTAQTAGHLVDLEPPVNHGPEKRQEPAMRYQRAPSTSNALISSTHLFRDPMPFTTAKQCKQ